MARSIRTWKIVLTTLFVLVDITLGTYVLLKRAKVSQHVSIKPVAHGLREVHWQEDLEFFAKQFPSVQVDFEKLYSPTKFQQDVSDLEQDIPQLKDSEIVLRLMQIIASGRISHDTVNPPGDLEFHPYPLQFFWYADGPAVTWAGEKYKSALGARIVRIGSMTPEELESAVATYFSHENLPWLHELSPDFIMNREVAEHFGLAEADGSVEFTFVRPGAEQFRLRVASAPNSQVNLISAAEALHLPAPLYRKHPDGWYWYEYLPDSHALYIQYTRCQDDPKKSFKDFT